ncbi:Hypothetical_protein [Hexamita inflata]|uniref:Hypothetical_protein n=1 Tax=Hexamita inflata TaxID=28002 RepID=A0AA86PSZ0_9EUKA|nr:Hypothetical protein HINF_LOCUS30638 [Hexamita inflata]
MNLMFNRILFKALALKYRTIYFSGWPQFSSFTALQLYLFKRLQFHRVRQNSARRSQISFLDVFSRAKYDEKQREVQYLNEPRHILQVALACHNVLKPAITARSTNSVSRESKR